MKLKTAQSDFFQLLIENSKEIICLQNEDGALLYANPAVYDILGYSPHEIGGKTPMDLIHPDDKGPLLRQIKEVLQNWKLLGEEPSIRTRYRIRAKNGWYKWLHSHITFFEAPDSDDIQILTNSQDVTFYMALEEELLTINRLSENSSALAGVGGWQWEMETERLTWSTEVKRIHDLPEDYIPTPEDAISCFHGSSRTVLEAAIAKALSEKASWDMELPIVTAKGNHKWIRTQGQVESNADGKILCLFGAMQDITSAYKIREQIQVNEQKFQAIFHAMFQFIGLLTPEGILLEANESALGFAGINLEDIVNKPFWEAFWWTDSSKNQIQHYVNMAAAGEFIRDEITVRSVHGEILTLDFSIKPILNTQGKVVLLIPEGRNITRQKQNEARLRLTQFSIEQASLPIIWNNADGTITYINDCGYKLLGLTKEETVGMRIWEIFPGATKETYKEHWASLRQGKVINQLYTYPTKDGRALELDVTSNFIAFGEGESCVSFFQDITERIRYEKELVENEERLRYAMEGTGGGLWDWNLITGDVYLSPIWKSMLDYQDSELESSYQTWYGHIHPEDKQKLLQTLQSVYDPGTNTFTLLHRLRSKNGNYRYIQSKGVVIQRSALGKPERIIGINSDLTEQTLIQEKLIEAQQRFHHAFFNSATGMALVAPTGGWIDVNEALCEITGYSRTELLQLTFQDITHPDDLQEDLKKAAELLQGKIQVHHMEKRYIHKMGHSIWVNLSATVVRNKLGEPQFFVSQIQDISSLKAAQQSLEKQNLRLISGAEHLMRKNKQLAEFSQIVSHNLRAPVSNISLLLQYYRNSESSEEKDELVELLIQSANALMSSLNELTEVIKIQQDKHIQKEELYFDKVFEKVRQMHAPQIADLKATIYKDFGSAPIIQYPSIYLESILMNLLNNALKYAAPGRPPVIYVRTYWEKGNLILTFADNGRGVNLEKHGQNMFKLYKTFHKHPDAKGLGLYMTKNQIEAMGGKIFVESKESEGTKFIINFNQYQAPNAE